MILADAIVTATNSTFAGNGSREVATDSGSFFRCEACTIRHDDAAAEAAIQSYHGNDRIELVNSVVVGDCEALGAGELPTSLGGNLESPGQSCGFGADDQENVASHGLGSLGWNGGPTRTYVPSIASPAIGGGLDGQCELLDQRGAQRSGTNCESGAVERAAVRPPILLFADGFQQGSPAAWSDAQP